MDLFDLPENPIPEGAVVQRIVAADGVWLRAAHFPPRVSPVRGTVSIFPGRGEQIEKYFPVVEVLRARGFACAVLDWRGQGGSQRLLKDPRKGHVGDFRHYHRDLAIFRTAVVLPDCPPPHFALAHSMGGTILLEASPHLRTWFSRMVLSAPFLDFAPPVSRAFAGRASGLACALGLGRAYIPGPTRKRAVVLAYDGNPLTSDEGLFALMMRITRQRPDLGVGPPTNRWIRAAVEAFERMERETFPSEVPMPVLLVNCGDDRVVSTVAVERMARRLRSVAYVHVPGARHEIMMERRAYREAFWAAFDSFIPGSADL